MVLYFLPTDQTIGFGLLAGLCRRWRGWHRSTFKHADGHGPQRPHLSKLAISPLLTAF